ncbi:MAG: hypothetical protein ABIN58_10485 [candidate division WOR-3 bacterium]
MESSSTGVATALSAAPIAARARRKSSLRSAGWSGGKAEIAGRPLRRNINGVPRADMRCDPFARGEGRTAS